jgi:type VI secretion system protein ImpG
MLDELLPFYERELSAIRALAAEFAERYPKVARRLQITPDRCDDPDVERLLQAFAWMAARIGRRLDDEVPELAEPLIEMLFPAFTRPVPSATILQLELDPGSGPCVIPRHSLALSPPVEGVRCTFRTTHDLELWPVEVATARLRLAQAGTVEPGAGPSPCAAVLTLELAARGGIPFRQLKLDRLRIFLDGEPELAGLLYELLCFRLGHVRVGAPGDPGGGAVLPAAALAPAGFAPEEALFEAEPGPCHGYRLMLEYFAFPEKFLFVELSGLGGVGASDRLQVQFHLRRFGASGRHRRLLETLAPGQFKLGCVPAVNLYPQTGAPVAVDGLRRSWPVLAAGRGSAAAEVYAIDAVTLAREEDRLAPRELPALFPVRRGDGTPSALAWCAVREPSVREGDPGTDMALALVDAGGQPADPGTGTLEFRLTCSDRHLPGQLPFGGPDPARGAFLLARHPLAGGARPLRRPTPRRDPPCVPGQLWRTVAHLFMSDLALAGLDRDRLQGLLELYRRAGPPAAAGQVLGVLQVETRPATTLVTRPGPPGFLRGTEVAVTLDESRFEGGSPYLFAGVLERFLAQPCPPDRFVQVRVSGRQGGDGLARWPPRAGGGPMT